MSTSPATKDYIIGDFIGMEIGEGMTLPALYALEAIFYLRLQLAQAGKAEDESVFEELCYHRFEQIAKILTKKFKVTESLDDKIAILNHLQNLSVALGSGHSAFVIDQRRDLIGCSNLTFAQKYRLDNLLGFNYDHIKENIDCLLKQARSAFDVAILFDVDSMGTASQYAAAMNLYEAMFCKAVDQGNVSEIAHLLAVAAYCNSDPNRRQKIKELTAKLTAKSSIAVNLPLPVLRVNSIAAQVYSRIGHITGKYDILSA